MSENEEMASQESEELAENLMDNEEVVDELVAKVQDAIEEEEKPTIIGNVIRRVFGIALMLVAALGVVVAVGIYQAVVNWMDDVTAGAETALGETIVALEGAQTGLTATSDTLEALGDTLGTAEVASLRVSQTLSDTEPLLAGVKTITTETVPDSLDTVQNTIPDMVQVAGVIDDTLATLAGFQYSRSVLGIDIEFGLGVEYEPAIPFDVSVQQVGDSLDGVPEQMRDLGVAIDVTTGNLQLVSDDLQQIATDIGNVNSSISALPASLDQINSSLTNTTDQIRGIRDGLADQLARVKQGILIFAIWLGSFQLAPLYLGYELLTGRRDSS